MRGFSLMRTAALLSLVAAGLAGCTKGSSSSAIPPTTATPGNPFSAGFAYEAAFVKESHFLKPATFGTTGFDVVVRPQNLAGLTQYAAQSRNPQSALYRHWLTPQQVGDKFFATAADYAAATKYLKAHGLQVTGWPLRYILHVRGTQKQLEQAFSTKFGWYKHRDETYLAPMSAPSVPKNVPIVGSLNIVSRTKEMTPSRVQVSNGLLTGYSPQQIQLAFDFAGAYNVGYLGLGITVGIIGTGPVSLQNGAHTGDLEAMRTLYRAQGTNTITLVPVVGDGFATPPQVTKPCKDSSNPNLPPWNSPTSTCNPEDGETQLDTEQVALLAPAATVKYFLGFVPDDGHGFTIQGLPLAPDEIQQALTDNTSDVLSISFGADEQGAIQNGELAQLQPMFAAAQSQGMSVFASAGDNGAYACQDGVVTPPNNDLCVSYPASDANVTAVGGVTTPLNSAGQFVGPVIAWGETTTGGFGGTGGGISQVIPFPSYQNACPNPRFNKGCPSGAFRNVPDVAMDADPLTGVAVLVDGDSSIGPRQILSFGGTSVAAPEMAAMWAEVLGVCKVKAGNCGQGPNPDVPYRTGVANPILYNNFSENGTQSWELTFFDVLNGTNGQFPGGPSPGPTSSLLPGENAGKGYDLTTGIGVPFTRALIRAVAGL